MRPSWSCLRTERGSKDAGDQQRNRQRKDKKATYPEQPALQSVLTDDVIQDVLCLSLPVTLTRTSCKPRPILRDLEEEDGEGRGHRVPIEDQRRARELVLLVVGRCVRKVGRGVGCDRELRRWGIKVRCPVSGFLCLPLERGRGDAPREQPK